MGNILIVEDESLVALRIENFLKKEGYHILDTIFESENVYKRAIEKDVDLILMDINLKDSKGDLSGIDIAKKIRDETNTPIIFITGYQIKEIMQKTTNIANTAFLNKPWKELELLAQVENFIKEGNLIKLDGEFGFCVDNMELNKGDETIQLNKKQRRLLKFFVENRNRLLTNEAIELEIWPDKIVSDMTRVSLISRLRSKLDNRFIVTSYGLGYIFRF